MSVGARKERATYVSLDVQVPSVHTLLTCLQPIVP